MPPAPGRVGPAHRVLVGVLLVASVAIAAACSAPFDPTGPCTADGRAAGAYPELEAAVPAAYQGAKPSQLDSGRICTRDGLATLAGHDVTELRFAGGTWSTGTDSGLSLAVLTDPDGPPLDPAWVVEFYETGARAGKNVTSVETNAYEGGLAGARRIDVLNGESYQSVVVWQRNGKVEVALVADFIREIQTKEAHDKVVRTAVDAFGG
jgi:hypothetical protein